MTKTAAHVTARLRPMAIAEPGTLITKKEKKKNRFVCSMITRMERIGNKLLHTLSF